MKKLLFLSAVGLLAFAGLAQAQEVEIARYGETDSDTAAMQQLRQGQAGEEATMEQVQARVQVNDGSGEMIQAQLQERVKTMQARKEQLREALQAKSQLTEKKQLLEQYKKNEVSEFAKAVNSRWAGRTNRFENISSNANKYFEKFDRNMAKLNDEQLAKKDNLLRAHDYIQIHFDEIVNLRSELDQLKEDENWDEWRNKINQYKNLLVDLKTEMANAIEAAEELDDVDLEGIE